MQKAIATATYLPDTVNPWGSVANPWPKDRGLAITGTFGNPPTGRKPNFSLVSGELLTSAIVITLVASLESIAIAKALASKHRQRNFNPSQEYIALGIANFWGSFTGAYPISGSFSRSALNDEVGATSPVAVLVVAFLVGIVVKIASVAPIVRALAAACCCLSPARPLAPLPQTSPSKCQDLCQPHGHET